MFFQQLFAISPDADITIRIMGKNGKYTIGVTPTIKEARIAPVNIVGTPQELDEGFIEKIKAPLKEAGLTINNLTQFQESLKEAEKEVKKEADKKPAPAAASKTAKKKAAPPSKKKPAPDSSADSKKKLGEAINKGLDKAEATAKGAEKMDAKPVEVKPVLAADTIPSVDTPTDETKKQSKKQQAPVERYSDEALSEFRELIQSRLETSRKELNYLQDLITRKDEAEKNGTEAEIKTEDGSGTMEREQLAQLASRQIQFINHLEKAMLRIENKTYGICRVTGKLIDKARLKAVPHATLSIEAKKTMGAKAEKEEEQTEKPSVSEIPHHDSIDEAAKREALAPEEEEKPVERDMFS